jgi:arsenate reductase
LNNLTIMKDTEKMMMNNNIKPKTLKMNTLLKEIIANFSENSVSDERKEILQNLIHFIQAKKDTNQTIRLNFICTHNSRRSHLAQIWAQTMAFHFGIKNIFCYSGGTEATAMFEKVTETLAKQGFSIQKLSENSNPVYAIKFAANENPIICFSKTYHNEFNPKNNFGAILTCHSADEGCPVVLGAEARFSIQYHDPKNFDGTALMDAKYTERSLQIAQEMWYVFSKLT